MVNSTVAHAFDRPGGQRATAQSAACRAATPPPAAAHTSVMAAVVINTGKRRACSGCPPHPQRPGLRPRRTTAPRSAAAPHRRAHRRPARRTTSRERASATAAAAQAANAGGISRRSAGPSCRGWDGPEPTVGSDMDAAHDGPAGARRAAVSRTDLGSMSAKRRAPMPLTSWSWSTEVKPPCSSRKSTMCWASTGPTPGSVSNCSTVAELRLTRAARRPAPRRIRAVRSAARCFPCTAGSRCTARDDLLTVDEAPGAVETADVRARTHSACRLQGVGDAGTARQPVDTRLTDLPCDVHHQPLARRLLAPRPSLYVRPLPCQAGPARLGHR